MKNGSKNKYVSENLITPLNEKTAKNFFWK